MPINPKRDSQANVQLGDAVLVVSMNMKELMHKTGGDRIIIVDRIDKISKEKLAFTGKGQMTKQKIEGVIDYESFETLLLKNNKEAKEVVYYTKNLTRGSQQKIEGRYLVGGKEERKNAKGNWVQQLAMLESEKRFMAFFEILNRKKSMPATVNIGRDLDVAYYLASKQGDEKFCLQIEELKELFLKSYLYDIR